MFSLQQIKAYKIFQGFWLKNAGKEKNVYKIYRFWITLKFYTYMSRDQNRVETFNLANFIFVARTANS